MGERTIMPFEPEQPEFLDADVETDAREYWGTEAAGCIFVARDTGRILLAHRSNEVDYEPETWGTWGGKVDAGETPKDAVEREVEEETGFSGRYKIHPLYVYRDGEFSYHNYMVIVPFEFTPQLNWENQGSAWVEYGQWPEPLHFGMEELIKHSGTKIQRVIELVKKRKSKMNEGEDYQSVPQGSLGIGLKSYKWVTPYGYLAYAHQEGTNQFYLLMVQTKPEFRNKGYSKVLVRKFFEHMKKFHGSTLNPGSYTMSGMAWLKHILERFSKEFGVRLVNGWHPQDAANDDDV